MRRLVWGALIAAACSGPPAPDVEVCRDTIHRLCLAPTCAAAADFVTEGSACEATLLTRTGCDQDSFVFTSPTRLRFLQCREPVVRAGWDRDQHPDCDDVLQMVETCPDVVSFFEGTPP